MYENQSVNDNFPNFCMACGYKLSPGDNFCQNCGVKVGETGKISQIPEESFCKACGAKLDDGDKFCAVCGERVDGAADEIIHKVPFDEYKDKINALIQEFETKEQKARTLIDKEFSSSQMSYDRFMATVNDTDKIFHDQVEIALKIIEMADSDTLVLHNELESKIRTLESIIDKMDDLISELIIHLSSNRQSNEEIRNLTEELDELINSVKDY